MRIVDLNKLSEEERKKVLEEQQKMLEQRQQASEELQRQGNQKFNELVDKSGTYNTTKYTSTMNNIVKAYKQTSKTSANNFKKANKITLWDSVMNIAQGLKNTTDRYSNNNMQNLYDNINNLRNNSEQVMYNRAKENNMNANFINNVQNNAKAYNEAIKKYQNDQIKNTVEYQNQEQLNTNMSENSLIEKTKEKMENTENNFDEYFKNLSKTERNQEINKIRQMLSNKDGLFETEEQKNKNKKIINDLILKSEVIDAEKKAKKVNKTLNEGNFIQRATTATGELASSMGKSAMDMTISPALTVGSLAEEILPTKDFKGPKFDEAIDYKRTQDYADAVKNENIELKLLKTGKGISSTIGGMIPSIIANIVAPGSNVGMITQASGVAGTDYIENLNENKTNKVRSALSGTLKGLGSYATEKITGGNILGKGSLDDWATKTIANKTSNKITQKIASKIYEVGGENFEELLENQIDHIVDATVNNKGVTFKDWLNEQSETVKQTTLTQVFLNLMGIGGNTYNEVQEYKNNAEAKRWLNEAQKIIDKENLSIDNLQISDKNINEVRNSLSNLPLESNTLNLQQNTTTTQNNPSTQQTIQKINKIAQNGNMEQMQQRLQELKSIDTSEMGLLEKSKIKSEIRALEEGYTSVDEWRKANEIKKQEAIKEYNKQKIKKELEKENSSSFSSTDNHKQQQLDIINKNNPADDDMHTWIRRVEDIKNFEEAFFEDGEYSGLDPDFTEEMANKAKETGKIIVYSSYPIEQGIFVSPSVMEASQYAGGNASKLYSKEVNINDIAWIDGAEGQYAKTENLANNQESLYNNSKERESDLYAINRGTQETDLGRNFGESRVLKERKQIAEQNYREWEQSVKPKQDSELTYEEQQLKKKIKTTQNKDIVFIKEDNGKGYYAGASLDNANTIYIKTEEAKKFGLNRTALHETMESNIRFSNESTQDIIMSTIDDIVNDYSFERQKEEFWKDQDGDMPSDTAIAKDIICDRLAELNGETLDYENVLSDEIKNRIDMSIEYFKKELGNTSSFNLPTKADVKSKVNLPTKEDVNQPTQGEKIDWNTMERPEGKMRNTKGTLNPTEISNLSMEDANTTPILSEKNYEKGNKQSSFFSNIVTDAKFLENDLRQEIGKNENIRYYKGITNEETLEKAYKSLNEEGKNATLNWFNKDSKEISAEDVAKGWILLKQYQDVGDYQSAVEVAKKMRDMGTKAGQAVQAYNILSRLTPEGMYYYAQSELTEAYNKMVEGKSKKWIEENRDKFDLTPEETKFIMENMNEVANMEDGYDKKAKIAEIQKIISDKIPPTIGQSVKSWMRISMLFNPKTQVRNIVGNAVILPVNISSDIISSGIDKVISKKTGVRTNGNINIKNYGKGFGKGLYESYNDFRKGINTRNIEGNRFEVSEGKNFKNKGLGKALNRVDSLLSFMLDAGDRGFYEATFTNSINNQLILNNTTEVTQEMIDIATNEALQRTWQDNNKYTEAVLKVRNILNYANIKGYGLGDVLIPFAKTPANLTKAIVDYSPAGLVKTITLDARTFKNSLQNGQFTPQMQHKFVQNLGKGMAGSFLYVLGYALAKAGIASGEADDDKDVKNFMKNSLGISSYSLKIGNKTFTYDWAQPVATPLAIMTNYVKYSKDNPDVNILEKGIKSLNIGTEQLLQQSFMESLNTVLNGNGTILENLSQAVLELPARAIPTFSKQITDMVDGTKRTSFEYGQPVKSAVNSVIAKIPIASKTLPISRDTLGNGIKKYGGENNILNVMFNPSNVNKGELSKAGEEIYRLYQETGETTVFPITAPYYINSNGEKITMTSEERSNYQKVIGKYTEKAIEELLSNSAYKELSNDKKAELITDIISDSNAKAKHDILDIETEDAKKKRKLIEKVGTKNYYDYRLKTKDIKGENASLRKNEVLLNANYSASAKEALYINTTGKEDKIYNILKDIDIEEYLEYKVKDSKEEFSADKDSNGNSISGTDKKKYYNYINSNITDAGSRLIILGSKYKLSNSERYQLSDYINKISSNNEEAIQAFEYLSKNYVVRGGKVYYK